MTRARFMTFVLCCCLALSLVPATAHAQYLGHNTKGDYGLMSASLAPPGWYLAGAYVRYGADTLRDRNGDPIAIDPERRGSLDVNGYAAGLLYVSERKILGGNYSFSIWPGAANNKLQIPILETNERGSTEFGDLYIQPFVLGWHKDRADYIAGLGVFAPTGSYEYGAPDNGGLGDWGLEIFGGATFFFDQAKTWNFATTAFYETHGEKDGTDITVGDILTLEGGLGKSFMEGAINVGVAYYAQWKMTADELGSSVPEGVTLGKDNVYGFGPEVNLPIASKTKLIAILTMRYYWETGARTTLEGDNFVFILTFPLPSVPLQ